VLLATAGNRFLTDTLETEATAELADVEVVTPEALKAPDLARDLAAGAFDLLILDGVRTDAPPECSTLSFGVPPASAEASTPREVSNPVVLDWDLQNPLMQYVRDINTLVIRKAQVLDPPTGARVLVEGDQGPLAMALPRGAYQDVYVAFPLLEGDSFNTNWPLKASFPLFVFNALRTLGGARTSDPRGEAGFAPGPPVVLRIETPAEQVEILDAAGRQIEKVARSPQGAFVVGQATRSGLYQVRWGDADDQRDAFAINLFDPRESNLAPRGQVPPGASPEQADAYKIKIGFNPIETRKLDAPATQEWWWALALAALGVVLAEWFVYNRRVYV
jgi:hypothetical protein